MAKKYVHLRLEEFSYKELRKMKNIYELEKNKELTFSEVILMLVDERITAKPFKLEHVLGNTKEKI